MVRNDAGGRAGAAGSTTGRFVALVSLANAQADTHHEKEGLRAARAALELARAAGDAAAMARALAAATRCHAQRSDVCAAIATALDALDACAGDRGGRALALQSIALAMVGAEDYERAHTAAEEAIADARAVGDAAVEGAARGILGTILAARGAESEARDEFRQAAAIHRRRGDREGLRFETGRIGDTYRQQGNRAEAEGSVPHARMYWKQALRVYRAALMLTRGQDAAIRVRIAECECRLGLFEQALATVALALETGAHSYAIVAPCRLWESHIHRALGDLRAASLACDAAHEAALALDDPAMCAEALRWAAKLRDLQGQFESAADFERRADELLAEHATRLARVRDEAGPLVERCAARAA